MVIDEIFDAPPPLDTGALRLIVVDHETGETIAERIAPDSISWSALAPMAGQVNRAIESGTMDEPFSIHRVNPWRVERRGDGMTVGVCAFIAWSLPHERAELACAIAEEMDEDEAQELLHAVIGFGFERMALNRIEVRCDLSEERMRAIYALAGFRTEAVMREQLRYGGAHHDIVMMSMLRGEWT